MFTVPKEIIIHHTWNKERVSCGYTKAKARHETDVIKEVTCGKCLLIIGKLMHGKLHRRSATTFHRVRHLLSKFVVRSSGEQCAQTLCKNVVPAINLSISTLPACRKCEIVYYASKTKNLQDK